ncbi:hypothetical protein [Streptomyces sp. TP-A0356]|uniref:hypothetical protein n=1 Tax=Streptomyces sp. TP-A0356 TaxID=1359208 RepID=UPI0006E304B6|nr:hypothetical protein [Streptomyces sp. TP-A0356]
MRRREGIADRRHALRDWAIPLCVIAVSTILVTAIATESGSGVEDSGRAAFVRSSPHAPVNPNTPVNPSPAGRAAHPVRIASLKGQ